MGFLCSLFKSSFENWIENASDEELSDGFEERRQQWMKDGLAYNIPRDVDTLRRNGEKTPEMKKIDSETSRRTAEKWGKDLRRNAGPNSVGLMQTDGTRVE